MHSQLVNLGCPAYQVRCMFEPNIMLVLLDMIVSMIDGLHALACGLKVTGLHGGTSVWQTSFELGLACSGEQQGSCGATPAPPLHPQILHFPLPAQYQTT